MTRTLTTLSSIIGAILYRTPPFRGKGRIVDATGRLMSRIVPIGTLALYHGDMSVDLRDRIQRFMWGGCYEPEIKETMARVLREGYGMIDIGAHIGYFTILGALIVGDAGKVWAFEPDPDLFRVLNMNTRRLKQVEIYNQAVWSNKTRLSFQKSFRHSETGWGSIVLGEKCGEMVLNVDAISLDEWMEEIKPNRVDLVKIDAEGAEPHILQGMCRLLRRYKPYLIIEVNIPLLYISGWSKDRLLRMVEGLGYHITQLQSLPGCVPSNSVFCIPC